MAGAKNTVLAGVRATCKLGWYCLGPSYFQCKKNQYNFDSLQFLKEIFSKDH